MRADSLLDFTGIGLEPAKDRRVVDLDATINQHDLEIAQRQGSEAIDSMERGNCGRNQGACVVPRGVSR
jgi:hypothetical protein